MEFDTIVVGGGTAGAVVASRLVGAGQKVLLLEAGPDYGERSSTSWPTELLDFASLPTSHDWGYKGTGAAGQPLSFDRAKVIGGCSTHNGCTQSAGWAADWNELALTAGSHWGADNIEEAIQTVARQMHFREYKNEEIQPFHAEFISACQSSGLPRRNDFLDLDGVDSVGVPPVNVLDAVRINTAMAYLDSVRGSRLLTIADNALVERICFSQQGRLEGVRYSQSGRVTEARSLLVILCAGAYGTPELMLRSGLGPAQHLEAIGIDVLHDLPGVGANLHDHPTVQLEYAGTRQLEQQLSAFAATAPLPEEQTVAKLRSPFADGPYDLHIYPWVERDESLAEGWKVVIPVSQLRPVSRGTVTLRSASPYELALINPRFLTDPQGRDVGSLAFGIRWIEEAILPQLKGYIGSLLHADPRGMSKLALQEWIRAHHTHYWHPAGSCRIGRQDDANAVVNGDGEVHAVPGLHIADASIFPTIPRATPALPVSVAAEIVSARIIAASTS